MGLDIYFHKVRKVRKNALEPFRMTLRECNDLNNKRAKNAFRKYAKRAIKALENARDEDEYKAVYDTIFPKSIKRHIEYEFYYSRFVGAYKPLDEVKDLFDHYNKIHGATPDAYFRKANFIYQFFSNKLEDEACFVTRNDLEELIKRCDTVLKDKDETTSEELLPTTGGFFFGSTDYDSYYYADVKDCKKQMTKLLKKYNEDTDVIYVIMSW